jgi:hypothetical protein
MGPALPPLGRGGRIRAIPRRLAEILVSQDRWWRLATSGILAFVVIAILLAYTRGALLYGIDFSGTFSFADLALRPRSDLVLPAVIAGAFPGHIYLAFYANLLLGAWLVSYACQSFTRSLFRRMLDPGELRLAQVVASALYLFSPLAVSYRFVGLIAETFLSAAAFFFVLAFSVEAARGMREGVAFSRTQALLLGLAIGLSTPTSLPNTVRAVTLDLFALGVVLVVFLVTYWSSRERRAAAWRSFRRIATISLPVGASLLLVPAYELLTNAEGLNLGNVSSIAAAYEARFASGPYNSLGWTLRLMGRGTFQRTPYYGLYQSNLAVMVGSWLWPLLALAVPVVLVWWLRPVERKLVVGLVAIATVGAIWDAGSNPPFGPIYDRVAVLLPYGPLYFQTYSISNLLLSKLYPPLMAFSIVLLARGVRGRGMAKAGTATGSPPDPAADRERLSGVPALGLSGPVERRSWRSVSAIVLVIATTVTATFVAWPVVDGEISVNWVSTSQHGFYIPPEYFGARGDLQSRHGNALLLPQLSTYVQTSWGYAGANGFYQNLNYPSRVLSPAYFGPYGANNPATVAVYQNATNPIVPGGSYATLPGPWHLRTVAPASGGVRHLLTSRYSLALTNTSWLSVALPVTNQSAVAQLLALKLLWVGLGSSNTSASPTAWYVGGGRSNVDVTTLNSTLLNLSVWASVPSRGTLNLSTISTVVVWERVNASNGDPLGAIRAVGGDSNGTVAPGWSAELGGFGIHYLLVDWSLVRGNAQPYPLVIGIVQTLAALGYLTEIRGGTYLVLYQIVGPGPAPLGAVGGGSGGVP